MLVQLSAVVAVVDVVVEAVGVVVVVVAWRSGSLVVV